MKSIIPSISSCLSLMTQYEMLENIREHSFVVASVAQTILGNLSLPRERIPPWDLIVAGALLHDIAKTRCLSEGCNHAEVGKKICLDHGYDEVAEIVNEHVILLSFDPIRYEKGIFSARDIIYYSDKRVNHDTIVTLEQRLQYIMERYGGNDENRHRLIAKNFQKCLDLENYLFSYMTFLPEELAQHVQPIPR